LLIPVKRGDKERYQKTDALDSKKLVQSIKIRCSKRCFIPTEEHEQFTTLARHRTQVTKKLRQTKSHIKSMLLFHGIKVPDEFDNSNWTIAFIAWLEESRRFSLARKNTHVQVYQIRIFRNCQSNACLL
jgi:hypothetical protein